jgi:ribosomal subunit interface protein
MNIYQLSGRNIEITDAIRAYLERKMERLDRYFDRIVDAKVVLSLAESPHVERRARTEIQVNVPGGVIRAEKVVLGTNGYTDDLWPGLRRSVVPVFSSIAATAPLPAAVVDGIMPMRAALYESGHITVYLRVDQQNRLLIGGRGPQRPIADPSPVQYLIRYAERLWPQLAGATWTHGWNGQLAMTADHYPHLHEPAPGIVACLGYNGRGVALSTAMGGEIAKLVTGTPARDIPMPVSPIRPIPLHGFWRVGVMAKVLEGRIRDRLGL